MARASTKRALGLNSKRRESKAALLRARLLSWPVLLGLAAIIVGIGLGAGLTLAFRDSTEDLRAGPALPPMPSEVWDLQESERIRKRNEQRLTLIPSAPVGQEKHSSTPTGPQSNTGGMSDPSLWVPDVALPPSVVPALPYGEMAPSGGVETAALPPDALPNAKAMTAPEPKGVPAWKLHAVPPPPLKGRPMIAVVIDDLGVDRRRSDRMMKLPGPLTASYMTYAHDLDDQAKAARKRGHEIMLHFPMEPQSQTHDPGPDALKIGQSANELRRRLRDAMGRMEAFVGVNNHMGSRFTAYQPGMQIVMEELRGKGLFFLDSLTSGQSVGMATAQSNDVPAVVRDIFIDNQMDEASVLSQLQKAEQTARRQGYAVAIGHPHDGTIAALARWIPSLESKGLVLVPLTTIVEKVGVQ